MPIDPVLAEARGLWEESAGVSVSFDPAGGVRVVVSPQSRMCPPGWVGAALLGGSALVTVPSQTAAAVVGSAFSSLPVESVVDGETVGAHLSVAQVLRPAGLGYLGRGDFHPAPDGPVIDRLAAGHSDLRRLEMSAGDEDAHEAGLGELTSPAFVTRDEGEVVAAAGYRYRLWPRRTAHLSVLTAPRWRGQGLGRATASSAVAHALAAGLLPQWRARPAQSRRMAAALGFRELGTQLSFKLR